VPEMCNAGLLDSGQVRWVPDAGWSGIRVAAVDGAWARTWRWERG